MKVPILTSSTLSEPNLVLIYRNKDLYLSDVCLGVNLRTRKLHMFRKILDFVLKICQPF